LESTDALSRRRGELTIVLAALASLSTHGNAVRGLVLASTRYACGDLLISAVRRSAIVGGGVCPLRSIADNVDYVVVTRVWAG
jgi:hypothetical protein